MANNTDTTTKTPIETNTDLIAEVQSLVDNLPEAGGGSGGGGINYGKPWVRPSNFPNYDYIDRTNEEALYLTYDCTVAKALPDVPRYAGIMVESTGGVTLEQGYVDNTGFHAESTKSYSSGNIIAVRLPYASDSKDFTVLRITPENDKHITLFTFYNVEGQNYSIQYCVEAWGRLPSLTKWGKGWGAGNGNCEWIESIDVITSTSFADLSGRPFSRLKNYKMDCSGATDLSYKFSECRDLLSLDLSGWDTSSATTMRNMFNNCNYLTSLDVSGWDTSKVENMQSMFEGCANLLTLNISEWNVSKVTNMTTMLSSMGRLSDLDLSGWNISSVTNLRSMCVSSSYKSVNLSGWDTSKVTDAVMTFRLCQNMTSLNLTGWVLSADANVNDMFGLCGSLTEYYPAIIHKSYSLGASPNLSLDSLARIIAALPTVTTSQTLTLHATAKAKLTEEQIATANSKGWTIA